MKMNNNKRPNAGKLKGVDKRKVRKAKTEGRRASHYEKSHSGY